jgi:uncharacterized protein YdaU (DUF1376 family)
MPKCSDTWMPFFVGDYLSATTRLTTEQHGAYVLLLLDYWKNGPPPNDDAVLAQIARLSPQSWKKARPALIGFFEQRAGHLIQRRVEKERQRAAENVEKRSKAGKASAEARAKAKDGGITCSTHVATGDAANAQQNVRPSPPEPQKIHPPLSPNPEDMSACADPPLTKREILEAWDQRMVPLGFPAVRKMTAQRDRQLSARLKDSTIEDWQRAMDALERSRFCRGENDRGWRADFDFLLQPKSFTKLLEGAYDH